MSYADNIRYQGVEEGVAKGRQLGVREGRQLGIQEGILQTAKNLLRQGVEMDTIVLATGLRHKQLLKMTDASLPMDPIEAFRASG